MFSGFFAPGSEGLFRRDIVRGFDPSIFKVDFQKIFVFYIDHLDLFSESVRVIFRNAHDLSDLLLQDVLA